MRDHVEQAKPRGVEPSGSWLTAALSEYAAIRGEIVASLAAQHAVFSYGIAAVGLLTAVAIGAANGDSGRSENAQMLVTAILLGLNPVLLLVILVLWTSEVLRMQRAGTYLFALENVINSRIGKPVPMAWEGIVNPPLNSAERTKRILPDIDAMQRWAVPLALASIATGSVISGVALGDPGIERFTLGALVMLAMAYLGLVVLAYFQGNRHWMRTLYDPSTPDRGQIGQTPPSTRCWADRLDSPSPRSWREFVRPSLRHITFVGKRSP
jgi:hypothetical protein